MPPPTDLLISTREKLKQYIESGLEYVLRLIFFWEKEDKRLGKLMQFGHNVFVYVMAIIYVILSIWSQSYFGFLLYVTVFGMIWVHHLICGGCVWTEIERRLVGESKCITDPLLELFHIPITPETSSGTFMMLSCIFMAILTMQLSSKTVSIVRHWFM